MGSRGEYRKSGVPSVTFAKNLRRAMTARGLFPSQVAARLRIDTKRVRRLLARDVHVRLDEVGDLARLLGVPAEALAFESPPAFAGRFPTVGPGGEAPVNREDDEGRVSTPRP